VDGAVLTTIERLRWEAARCRELAEGIGRTDPTQRLVRMAEEFEARAAELEAALSGQEHRNGQGSTQADTPHHPHPGVLGPAGVPPVSCMGAR
jgi:hypothetical protein